MALDQLYEIGKAAIIQDWYKFTLVYGAEAGPLLAISHRQKYGHDLETRRQAYLRILDAQVKEEGGTGILLVPGK